MALILFLKAQVSGGAVRDLFSAAPATVHVAAYTRKDGAAVPAHTRIVKVHRVHDTRQYEEGPDEKWYPVPGSGSPRPCDRCGRTHEVHADVETSDGKLMCVGTGCMTAETADVQSRIKSATSAAKTARRLAHEVAALRAKQTDYDRHKAEVEALPLPLIERGETTVEQWGKRQAWKMGDATVYSMAETADPPPERAQAARNAWRQKRMAERGHAHQVYWPEGIERRLSQAQMRANAPA